MYNAKKRRIVSGESWRQTYVDNEVGEDRKKGEVQHEGLAGRPDGRGE